MSARRGRWLQWPWRDRSAIEQDVDEEIAFHLDMRTAALMAEGLDPQAARAAALREFGDTDQARSSLAAADRRGESRRRRSDWLHDLRQDTAFAWRTLRRAPGFAAVAVLTLTLGIGANTAMFSVVHSVLLRPLPYAEPERVVMIWNRWKDADRANLSQPEFLDFRDQLTSLQALAVYATGEANLTSDGEPERVAAAAVTWRMLDVLGARPALGRGFTPADDVPDNGVVMLTHALWQRRYAGDPAVIGRSVIVGGNPLTVIGVLPPGLELPMDYHTRQPAQLWVPLGIDEQEPAGRGSHYLIGVGRLRDDATAQRLDEELQRVVSGWVEAGHIGPERRFEAFSVPVTNQIMGDVRPALLLLLGAVGVVLLIACANVASLLLARSDARRREIALRTAIGASRGRIVRQLLTESLMLSIAGGLGGLVLAAGAVRLLAAAAPAQIPRVELTGLDPLVLVFTGAVVVLTGILFGLAPALQASAGELAKELREGGRGSTAGRARQRFRRALVAAEIAFSLVLMIGAGLLIRSFVEMNRIELGFRPEGVQTARLSLASTDYPDSLSVVRFYREAIDRIAQLPGVHAAGAVRVLPLEESIGDWGIDIEGKSEDPANKFKGDWQVATPGYFHAAGLKLVAGRFLQPTDDPDAPLVGLINRTMAEKYWAGENPIGRRYRLGNEKRPWVTVVGIVDDVRHNAVIEEPRTEIYMPHEQIMHSIGAPPRTMTVVIRSDRPAEAVLPAVRREIRAMDPQLPVTNMAAYEDITSAALSGPRFTTLLLAGFAGLALLLAGLGVYGVIAYMVSQRRHEMGVRLALGAAPRGVIGLVVREGLTIAAAGVLVGTLAAAWLVRLLSSLVYGVETLDPMTFVVGPVLLIAVALLACWVPARRASRVDPLVALRSG